MLSAITGGLAPSGKRPGDVKILLFLVSPDANAEGGCTMELNEVLALLTLIVEPCMLHFRSLGQSSKKSITIRNDRPRLRNLSGHSY